MNDAVEFMKWYRNFDWEVNQWYKTKWQDDKETGNEINKIYKMTSEELYDYYKSGKQIPYISGK